MTRVVVTDHAFGGVAEEAAVAERFGAEFSVHACRGEDETIRAVAGADVAFVNFAPVTDAVLAAMAPGATVIRYGIGYDNVDVAAAEARGISVATVPDYGSETVADHTVALLRKIPAYAAFGFRVLAHDPYAEPADGLTITDLDTLLRESHAVSLHTPLTLGTRHLLGAAAFARMREGAVLVNTSRGGLVDPEALAAAVRTGRVAAAALDVFDPEPLAADSPPRELPQILFTPHAACYSDSSLAALQRLAAEEAERALAGKPLRCPVTGGGGR